MSLPTAPLHSSLTTTLAFLTIPLLYRAIHTRLSRSRQKSPHSLHSLHTSSSSSSNTSRARSKPTTESTIPSPFPPVIRHMLSSCRLSYLSTVDGDSAHLSLMRFTYMWDDDMDQEIIVMSTQRRTKKFEMLRRQKGVALLVHDFPQHGSGGGGEGGVYSITLNGDCTIVEEGELAFVYFTLLMVWSSHKRTHRSHVYPSHRT